MALPEQLLLSDLLRRRVRCDQGLDRGHGVLVWMHPPVHRVLGWVSRPSMFGNSRLVWRLNQLRALLELEALVQGDPAETDQDTLDRLPTLMDAALLDRDQQPIATLVDAALEPSTGRIRHYLVSRSDPRLPGSSRWRLSPERIVDQQPGRVFTALAGLDDLPLARASVRQEFLRRSRHWRDQVQQVGERFETRLEGWLEEPPWDAPAPRTVDWQPDELEDEEPPLRGEGWSGPEPWDEDSWAEPEPRADRQRQRDRQDDPWV
ncbi:MAG: RNA methyltransferase [Cyanobium sp.]|nr:RNA methyltransferase [Cyanobium sp.]